jgi:hypothetical protein
MKLIRIITFFKMFLKIINSLGNKVRSALALQQ